MAPTMGAKDFSNWGVEGLLVAGFESLDADRAKLGHASEAIRAVAA